MINFYSNLRNCLLKPYMLNIQITSLKSKINFLINKRFIIIFCLLITAGCHDITVITPADNFRSKYPDLSAHYTILKPTSYESIYDNIRLHYMTIDLLLDSIKKSFSDCEGLDKYLSKIQGLKEKERKNKLRALKSLKELISSTDYLYEFDYKDGEHEESGLLIINVSGEIKYREIYISNRNWLDHRH